MSSKDCSNECPAVILQEGAARQDPHCAYNGTVLSRVRKDTNTAASKRCTNTLLKAIKSKIGSYEMSCDLLPIHTQLICDYK